MIFILVPLIAIIVSGLTFISGFGLGTLLMPVFALFFPIPIAIAATAIVHLANNLFKILLIGKYADRRVVILFGIPGMIGAFVGSYLLFRIFSLHFLAKYNLFGHTMTVEPIKIVIGILITLFAIFEMIPRFENLQFSRKLIPLGGFLSGFFGGISGMQGALRSAFLARSGLSKIAFIGTNTVCAVIVDISRISIYGTTIFTMSSSPLPASMWNLVVITTIAAFLGAFIGKRFIEKITFKTVQIIIGIMLFLFGILMSLGIV